jgi:hypothetical protein
MIIPYEKIQHLFGKQITVKRIIFIIDEERLKKYNSLIHPYDNKYFYLSHINQGFCKYSKLYFDENGILYLREVKK